MKEDLNKNIQTRITYSKGYNCVYILHSDNIDQSDILFNSKLKLFQVNLKLEFIDSKLHL